MDCFFLVNLPSGSPITEYRLSYNENYVRQIIVSPKNKINDKKVSYNRKYKGKGEGLILFFGDIGYFALQNYGLRIIFEDSVIGHFPNLPYR